MHLMFLKNKSSPPEDFLGKRCFEICSKFIGEYPCESVISVKLPCNFIEIRLWFGCSPVGLQHHFRTLFAQSTSGEMPSKEQPCQIHYHRM